MSTGLPRLRVVAAVIEDGHGRVLIGQRPPGKHMAGLWEFPGGKRKAREGREAALARELEEELGVTVRAARPLIRYVHDYPGRSVELDVWRVERYEGRPGPLEGQALDWVAPGELAGHGLLPADTPIIRALRLPPLCAITGDFDDTADLRRRARAALAAGAGLLQLRSPEDGSARVAELLASLATCCRERGARLVVNGDPAWTVPLAEAGLANGVHLPARHLAGLRRRPLGADLLVGASCHDATELEAAVRAGLDYAFLSPVRRTRSHPAAIALGWRRFAVLVRDLGLPVYGLGGLGPADLRRCWRAGGQGIAAISSLWPPAAA